MAAPVSTAASQPGIPILVQQFGTDLMLAVQVAWGADLTQSDSTWAWTDVTEDVQTANNGTITITIGEADESIDAQPAECTFTLDNRSNRYSPDNALCINWPNVVRNTPIQIIAIYQGATHWRFEGYATSWTPGWDSTGRYAWTSVVVNGVKRRLQKGQTPLKSPLTRSIPGVASLVAYWPCEDGSQATQLEPLVGTFALGVIAGTLQPASYSGFVGSAPIPTFATDSWSARIPAYTDSGSGQLRFLIATPAAGMPDQTSIVKIATFGSIASVELRYAGSPSGLRLIAFDSASNILADSGAVGFGISGTQWRISIQWTNSGGNVNFTFSALAQTVGASAGYTNLTATGQTLNGAQGVTFAPSANMTGVSLGQIYFQNTTDNIFNLAAQLQAFVGENPASRMQRLCGEQGENVSFRGDSGTSNVAMGPQPIDTFYNLITQAAMVDGGILYDGRDQGLTLQRRSNTDGLENAPVAVLLDASAGDVKMPFAPIDDDQLNTNMFTATRQGGSVAVSSDSTSALGTKAIGEYDNSATLYCQFDSYATDYAAWQVHMGTAGELRYADLTMMLEAAPHLMGFWLATRISGQIQIVNLSSVRTQASPEPVQLTLRGYTETIDQFTWHVQAHCTPYQPWRVIILAQDTGDTDPNLCHLDTDGANITAAANIGDTTLTVATPSGPLWTTIADDFPFDVNIAGIRVTVSNITGASSPQTFTVTGITKPLPVNSAVTVWKPPVLGL